MPTRGGVEGVGYVNRVSMVESAEVYGVDRRLLVEKKVVFKDVEKMEKEEKRLDLCNSASESSSIGKNSDISDKSLENFDDNEEVQSSYKGPLDAMEALEEVLPIRRGISRFYNGKSKSFASLSDASSSSIKELTKPENAYSRKRRNLLACSLASWDKNRSSSVLKSHGGGILKRMNNPSRTTLALAVAMSNSERENPSVVSSFPAWRSFSLADLQQSPNFGPKTDPDKEMLIDGGESGMYWLYRVQYRKS